MLLGGNCIYRRIFKYLYKRTNNIGNLYREKSNTRDKLEGTIHLPKPISLQKMSNLFKTNSRFAALLDDEDNATAAAVAPMSKRKVSKEKEKEKEPSREQDTHNTFKSGGRGGQRRERDRERERENPEEERIVKEFEKQNKERKQQESLKLDHFPALGGDGHGHGHGHGQVVAQNVEVAESFAEKLLSGNTSSVKAKKQAVDPDLVGLKPGWILLKRENNQTVIKGLPEGWDDEDKVDANTAFRRALSALTALHESRTQYYIEQYGFDIWEKVFRCPNYDYDFFNRLDEETQQECQDRENEYREYDDAYYNNNYS